MKTEYKAIIIPDYLVAIHWISKGNKCATDLKKELNITYKHLHELKHTFISLGWVSIVKEERKHIMFLTEKGKKINEIANEFFYAMNIDDNYILKQIQDGKIKKSDSSEFQKENKNSILFDANDKNHDLKDEELELV